ncbi:hypothetical protein AAC387_Pa07g0198 [Persea americana]
MVWNIVGGLYRCLADIIYQKGRFYCIGLFSDDIVVIYINDDNTTCTETIRVTRGVIYWEGRSEFRHQTYLVADSASESLFIVKRWIRWHSVETEAVLLKIPNTYAFEVYELGLEESRKYKTVRVA